MAHLEPLSIEEFMTLTGGPDGPPRPPGAPRNSERTMARRPELFRAFGGLARAAFAGGTLPPELKNFVAIIASQAAGCRYCQAHRVNTAVDQGIEAERIAALWTFEDSDLFDSGEKAALRYAQAAAVVPNAVTADHFAALRDHFDDGEIVELTGVIATMGFLNRWNDSLATELEDQPLSAARDVIPSGAWGAGKHSVVRAEP